MISSVKFPTESLVQDKRIITAIGFAHQSLKKSDSRSLGLEEYSSSLRIVTTQINRGAEEKLQGSSSLWDFSDEQRLLMTNIVLGLIVASVAERIGFSGFDGAFGGFGYL